MNEQELARRRHEYLMSQISGKKSELTEEPARAKAFADRRGSYATTIPCENGHQASRFTDSTHCCICYEERKKRKALETQKRGAALQLERERARATKRTQEQYDQAWEQPPSSDHHDRKGVSSTRLVPQIGDS